MASTEAQKRAVKKAQSKCDAIMLRPPKEEGVAIRAAAVAAGQSNQQYILQAARERMKRDTAATGMPTGTRVVSLPSNILIAAQEAAGRAGEGLSDFVSRAVTAQAKRDEAKRAFSVELPAGETAEEA